MSEIEKPDRITFSPDTATDRRASETAASGKGFRFRRFSQSSRDGDRSGLFTRSRSATKDRDQEAGVYDEGFDAPRPSDFRQKQIFHGWKLILFVLSPRRSLA
jgi:hypothetical protein